MESGKTLDAYPKIEKSLEMKFKTVDQVAIAVPRLDEAVRVLREVWEFEPSVPEEVLEQGVRLVFAQVGETRLEFMEASSDSSPLKKFLEKRGPGVQHIAFSVDDLEATLQTLKAKGVQLLHEKPLVGAEGAKIAFVHPHSFFGVLLELIEKTNR